MPCPIDAPSPRSGWLAASTGPAIGSRAAWSSPARIPLRRSVRAASLGGRPRLPREGGGVPGPAWIRQRGRAGGSWAGFLLAWWLLAGSIAPHAFGRRHWSIAEAWASTPGFRNGGGFRNARWRFRNGLFRRRRDGAGSADDPDWTWRRLRLLTEQLLASCPVQHPPSVHHRASGPSVFSWCSVTSTS
jgi:hypothetical protein